MRQAWKSKRSSDFTTTEGNTLDFALEICERRKEVSKKDQRLLQVAISRKEIISEEPVKRSRKNRARERGRQPKDTTVVSVS